jgi:sec-independent protein translocase protein TatA
VLDFLDKPSVLIVLLVLIVVFGAKRLPDSARALGRSMRILKAEAKGLRDDDAPATPTAAPEQKALPAAPPSATVETAAEQTPPRQT